MSLGSDIVSEMAADFYAFEGIIEDAARAGIWTMKDGTRIPVTEMTDLHIRNTIRMLERKDKYDIYMPWITRLREELERRST